MERVTDMTESQNYTTLDALSAEAEYGGYELRIDDENVIRFVDPLGLRRKDRKKLKALLSEFDNLPDDAEDEAVFRFLMATPADYKALVAQDLTYGQLVTLANLVALHYTKYFRNV